MNVACFLFSEPTTKQYYYQGICGLQKTVLEKVLTTQKFNNSNYIISDTLICKYFETGEHKGRLEWERRGNKDGSITTTYDSYGKAGVCLSKTVSAAGCISRTETYEYDNTQRFVNQVTNPVGHITKYSYDGKNGNKITETDPNNLITTYQYDAFGNLTKILYPDSTKTSVSRKWNDVPNLYYAKYFTSTTSSGKPELRVYYDVLGRELCRKENNFYYQIAYNEKGQVIETSGPSGKINHTSATLHEYTYDDFGRKLTETAPFVDLSYKYDKMRVTVQDNLRNVTSYKDYDALGRITEADDAGGTIVYSYYVTEEKKHQTTISTNGAITTILTDLWGNRLSIKDPDAGKISSTYNKFNELETQTDARGFTTHYQYDKLGRVTQKKYTQAGAILQTLTYIYDLKNKFKGKLYQIKMDGTEAESFTYDNYGRLFEHKKIIDGTSYTQKYDYNKNGLLSKLTYPENFAVKYNYSSTGELEEIRNYSNNALIYKVEKRNEYHAPLGCTYGNDAETFYTYNSNGMVTRIQTGSYYEWDPTLNDSLTAVSKPDPYSHHNRDGLVLCVDSSILNYRYAYNDKGLMISRSESVMEYAEQYEYDDLDRVTGVISEDIAVAQNISYKKNGNIKTVGTEKYTYDTFKPHAVTQIAPPKITNSSTVTYNFFNQPTEISEDYSQIYLYYGADQQRNKMVKNGPGATETRFYINQYYEKKVGANNHTTHYHYIYGDHGAVALHIADPATDSIYYIHTDHLGSFCALTDENKVVRQRNFFDACQFSRILFTAKYAKVYTRCARRVCDRLVLFIFNNL